MEKVKAQPDRGDSVRLPIVGDLPNWVFVAVAVLLAALLRIVWAKRYGLSIEMEGAEYGRLAENLITGRGYVGMYNNGTQLVFPPLYPFAIAAISLLFKSPEFAERLINIVCGATLVIPMFGICRRLYGQRVAVGVAVLVVFHPILIAGGASTYSEGPYLLLLMSALLWLMKHVDDGRLRGSVIAGALLGLAYLARPEAFLLVPIFVGYALLRLIGATNRWAALRGPGSLALAFFLVALPHIAFLTVSTGKVRLEAKGAINYQLAQRMNAGMSLQEAINGIGDDLSPHGMFIMPNLDVIKAGGPAIGDYARFFLKTAPHNLANVVRGIVDRPAFGGPALFALVVLGLFGRGWDRQRLRLEGILLLTCGVMLFVLVMIPSEMLWFRYFYPLLGLLLLWAANGADALYEWGQTSLGALVHRPNISALAGRLFKWGSLTLALLVALQATPSVDQFRESLFPERALAGRWLAKLSKRPVWLMDTGLQVSYYAGGYFSPLPYSNSDVALRFIAKLKPEYIVLHSLNKSALPYTEQWYDSGIPDARASLIYEDGAEQGVVANEPVPKPHGVEQDQIKVYRWSGAAL